MEEQHLYDSPIGPLLLSATSAGLSSIAFASKRAKASKQLPKNAHLKQALKELEEYFSGKRSRFSCKLDPQGTSFQQRVWRELTKIPIGETTSYGAIAEAIGSPKASRAVGGANNRNPIPILIPCHRVIGANRALIGYAGKLWRKRWLLEREGVSV